MTEPRTLSDLSTRRAIVYGVVAAVVALVLVFAQLTVAQVEGIDQNIGTVQERIAASYATLDTVVAKSEPTAGMADQVGRVVADQAAIAVTMGSVNRALLRMASSTRRVARTTATMARTNRGVGRSLRAMSGDVTSLTATISGLVPVSRSTGANLASMQRLSAATSHALASIVGKLLAYGLPQARG